MKSPPRLLSRWGLILILLLAAALRLYRIGENQFFFYDEALFLQHNIDFLLYFEQHPPENLLQYWRSIQVCFHMALLQAKALWAFICNSRVFFVDVLDFYFVRIVCALFGLLTVWMTYLFSKRFFEDTTIALSSALILAVLPSHVFYSRLALQESVSAFFFLAAMHLYFFPNRWNYRTFLSGILLAGAFFVNYRLIFLPVLVLFSEWWIHGRSLKRCDWRRYVWAILTFFGLIFTIGHLDNGANTNVNFAWMFRQAHGAHEAQDFLRLLSYPYYTFRLESFWFGIIFWANLYFLFTVKDKKTAFPFLLVCLQMAIFSFAQDQGARYICVVVPFMAMAAAYVIRTLRYQPRGAYLGAAALIFLLGPFLFKSFKLANIDNAYMTSMADIQSAAGRVKVLSTQPLVQQLAAYPDKLVGAAPRHFSLLLAAYSKGFRYLIIDPQAYVSYTQSDRKFDPPLTGYLEFILKFVKPVKIYPHFNQDVLERFVFEHSTHLNLSRRFLKDNPQQQYGALRVYDIAQCLATMKAFMIGK